MKRDVKKMSVKEMRKAVDEMTEKNADAMGLKFDEIPASARAKISRVINEPDKNNRDCLFVTWEIIEGKLKGKSFVSKYTAFHYTPLIKALEGFGLKGFEVGQKFEIELKPFSMGYPRHVPIEMLD